VSHVIAVPDPSLILLIGAAGSGKSTFARTHFKPVEIISSDFCRALVCNKEADQSATLDAFDVLRLIVRKRLRRGLLTVVDATNVQLKARRRLLPFAVQCEVPAIAIVFDVAEEVCLARNQSRPERQVRAEVVREQMEDLKRARPLLAREGFSAVHVFADATQSDSAVISRSAHPWRLE